MGRHLERVIHAGLRLAGVPLLALAPALALPAGEGRADVLLAPPPLVETPGAGEEPELSPAEAEVHRILRRARDPEGPPAAEAALELVPVAREALPLLVEILRARRVPAVGELRAQTLSEPQQEILLGALAGLEPAWVLEEMQRMLAQGRTRPAREAAMRLIGAVGKAADLPLLLDLPIELGEPELHPALANALRVSLAELVRRDREALNQLYWLWSYRPVLLLPPMIEGLGDAADPRALRLLDDLLVRHESLLVPVLAQIRRIGASRSKTVNEMLALRLRRHLDPHSPVCRQAVFALTSLRDHDSIPSLIDLLAEGTAGVRADAHFALRELTGLTLHPRVELWDAWYQAELDWVDAESQRVLVRLVSSDTTQVTKAIGELARRRLYSDRWALELAPLLRHTSSSVRLQAARALLTLRSPYVAPALVEALDDDDAQVREAAHKALVASTGKALPADGFAWQGVLEGAEL